MSPDTLCLQRVSQRARKFHAMSWP